MDSFSTLHVPALGYGIRYEFGICDQEIRDGWQVEITDKWLGFGNPWEILRPELSQNVNLGGRTEPYCASMDGTVCAGSPIKSLKAFLAIHPYAIHPYWDIKVMYAIPCASGRRKRCTPLWFSRQFPSVCSKRGIKTPEDSH
jgi:glucan phosphorylase